MDERSAEDETGGVALGTHVLIDGSNAPSELLDDPACVRDAVTAAAQALGATVIDVCVHRFSPRGVTVVATLAESHLAVHTWPELGSFAADLFYCGPGDFEAVVRILRKALGAADVRVRRLRRGAQQEDAVPRPPLPAASDRGAGMATVSAVRLVLTAAAWMIGLFALLRLGAVQRYLLLPLAAAQQTVASQLSGAPSGAVVLDASCSGADVLALCLGVIFAFPARWGQRLRGAAGGLLLIGGLNTLRIGHLSLVAGNPALLEALHVYVWPALMTAAVLAYAFVWLRRAAGTAGMGPALPHPGRRFLAYAVALTGVYFALAPRLFDSATFQRVATWVAGSAGLLMSSLGAGVEVSGSVLRTTRGAFVVTQECIVTPLIVVYVAAVLSAPLRRSRKALALAAAPPLFFALGMARLLVLAVPAPFVSSPGMAVHGFSQMLVGVILVGAGSWIAAREGRQPPATTPDPRRPRAAVRRGAKAIASGTVVGLAAAATWTPALRAGVAAAQSVVGHGGHILPDPQGALRILPAYQVGLLTALWVASGGRAGWRRLAAGIAALSLSQAVLLAGLGELFEHVGFRLHISLIRAWAVAAPVVVALLIDGRPAGLLRASATPPSGAGALHETSDPSASAPR